jgi:type IX secretion system PorP/SprF family membrane protein
MQKRLLLFLLPFFFSGLCRSQDLIFSQFHAVPAQINPALIGTTIAPKFVAGYRNRAPQWPNAYVSYVAMYDQYIDKLNSGIGVSVMHDRHASGIFQVSSIHAQYVYNASISRTFGLRIGVEGGIRQEQLDYNSLIFFDQLHPETGIVWPDGSTRSSAEVEPGGNTVTNLDVGAGITFYANSFYLGISAKHINTPDFNFLNERSGVDYGLDLRYSAQMGIDIALEKDYRGNIEAFVSPYALYVQQGGSGQLNAGVFGGANRLYGGLWYRHALENPDAVIAMLGLRAGLFKIAYSYDFIVSELADPSAVAAHEITITVNFEESERLMNKYKEQRFNDCFRLFR